MVRDALRAPHHEGIDYFLPDTCLAICPNMTFRVSSLNGSLTNFPIANPACTCGRARTTAYHRFTLAKSSSVKPCALWVIVHGKQAMSAMEYSSPATYAPVLPSWRSSTP